MSAGEHQELSPYLCWLLAARCIERGCPQLRPLVGDPFVAERELARPGLHQSYRVEPAAETYGASVAVADHITRRRSVVVTLLHDYNPGSHEPSWLLAASDFETVLQALLTRAELFRIGQPAPVAATASRRGAYIVQALTVSVSYTTQLRAQE